MKSKRPAGTISSCSSFPVGCSHLQRAVARPSCEDLVSRTNSLFPADAAHGGRRVDVTRLVGCRGVDPSCSDGGLAV